MIDSAAHNQNEVYSTVLDVYSLLGKLKKSGERLIENNQFIQNWEKEVRLLPPQ